MRWIGHAIFSIYNSVSYIPGTIFAIYIGSSGSVSGSGKRNLRTCRDIIAFLKKKDSLREWRLIKEESFAALVLKIVELVALNKIYNEVDLLDPVSFLVFQSSFIFQNQTKSRRQVDDVESCPNPLRYWRS